MVLNFTSFIFVLGEFILPCYESLFLYSGISVDFLFILPLFKFFEIKFPFALCRWISSLKFLTLCFKWSQCRVRRIGYSFCTSWHSASPGSDVDLKCFSKTFNVIVSSSLHHDFFCTDFCFVTHSFVPINRMKSTYFKVTTKGAFPHFFLMSLAYKIARLKTFFSLLWKLISESSSQILYIIQSYAIWKLLTLENTGNLWMHILSKIADISYNLCSETPQIFPKWYIISKRLKL